MADSVKWEGKGVKAVEKGVRAVAWAITGRVREGAGEERGWP